MLSWEYCRFKNTYFAEDQQTATSETFEIENSLLPGFKILANSLKNTCKGFHFCRNTAGYRIIRAVVCVQTDNNLITIFTTNQFSTRNLQSIKSQLTCFYFSPLLQLNSNSIYGLSCFFSLLLFLSFLSSPLDYWIVIVIHLCVLLFLILEIIPPKIAS